MNRRILIVDDSATARSIIRRVLEINGLGDFQIEEAGSGAEAIALLKEQKCDLVFSDLNMPEMDGEGLLKRVKSSPKLQDIPVVIVSSLGNPAKERKLIQDHARAVFSKPISVPEISQFLKEYFNNTEDIDDEF